MKIEASAFNGHEPDAARWNFERPRFDSGAARFSLNPRPWLSAQVSAAELRAPESLHPSLDVRRYTASVSYAGTGDGLRPRATVAWGRNVRSALLPSTCPLLTTRAAFVASCAAAPPYAPSRVLDAFLAEATVRLRGHDAAFVRAEHVHKDELFASADPLHNRVFPVASVQAGYRYELPFRGPVSWGLGASGAVALLPEFLAAEYGRRPLSYWIFADARLR